MSLILDRGDGFQKMAYTPDTSVITSQNTQKGDVWLCEAYARDSFERGEAVNSSYVLIGKERLWVSDVDDNSSYQSPMRASDDVRFSIYWDASVQRSTMAYVCNSSDITPSGCLGKSFGTSSFTEENPIEINSTHVFNESGNHSYHVMLCDESWNCSEPIGYDAQGKSLQVVVNEPPVVNSIELLTTDMERTSIVT